MKITPNMKNLSKLRVTGSLPMEGQEDGRLERGWLQDTTATSEDAVLHASSAYLKLTFILSAHGPRCRTVADTGLSEHRSTLI